jgi:hypothetical protein
VKNCIDRKILHPDDASDDEATDVDFDRETCTTATGEAAADTVGWWVPVHVARALGFRPAHLHDHRTVRR